MPISHRDPAALTSRLLSDHDSHMQSLANALAGAIAGRLNDRTKQIDPRRSARARVTGFKTYRTATGGNGVKVSVVQTVNDDLTDIKRQEIRQQQDVVRRQAVTKAGALTLLSSKGVV